MHKHIKKHGLYYVFMAFLLAIGVLLSFHTAYNRQLQIYILIFTSVAYVVWGIFHHFLEHDINLKIVIEYILIAALGITIVMLFLKGGL